MTKSLQQVFLVFILTSIDKNKQTFIFQTFVFKIIFKEPPVELLASCLVYVKKKRVIKHTFRLFYYVFKRNLSSRNSSLSIVKVSLRDLTTTNAC